MKGPGGYLRAGAATLDQVAEVLEVAGVGAAQKVKHQEDRKKHKRARDKWKAERRERRSEVTTEFAQTPSAEPAEVVALPDAKEEMPVKVPVDVLDVVAAVQGVFDCLGFPLGQPNLCEERDPGHLGHGRGGNSGPS